MLMVGCGDRPATRDASTSVTSLKRSSDDGYTDCDPEATPAKATVDAHGAIHFTTDGGRTCEDNREDYATSQMLTCVNKVDNSGGATAAAAARKCVVDFPPARDLPFTPTSRFSNCMRLVDHLRLVAADDEVAEYALADAPRVCGSSRADRATVAFARCLEDVDYSTTSVMRNGIARCKGSHPAKVVIFSEVHSK